MSLTTGPRAGRADAVRGVSKRRALAVAGATVTVGDTVTSNLLAADVLAQARAATAPPPAGTDPDFGPHVLVFDPSMPAAQIQSRLDEVADRQVGDEMGTGRFAVLFKPGRYEVDARLGYYTTVAGLGTSPDETVIRGAVRVTGYPDPAAPAGVSALANFWRSAENLAVEPTDWSNQWAVSQASPLRRVHIKGTAWLEPGNKGYSSGGFMADSKIDGITISGTQQQWLTRNCELGDVWTNGVWNQVFSGVTGAVPVADFPNNPYTVLPTSPVTREKPFLYVDEAGSFRVFLPALRHDTAGTTWSAGQTQEGTSLPVEAFYLARPGDSALTLNLALALGKHLLLTPGIYHLEAPLVVARRDTVILGLGMPTLTPDRGTRALLVGDVDGVRVAGVLVDAGPVRSDVLVEIGVRGSHRRHTDNPISLQDVFFRIGGPWAGSAGTTLAVHADDTLLENVWAWRADHGEGFGWTVNPAETGVEVNGDRVLAYGLFVEHYQRHQTVWNGEDGRTVFYQSELPYDPPGQDAWTSPTGLGYASYLVGEAVRRHEAWGLGVYCYFNQGVDIRAARAVEAPQRPDVRFHHLVHVFLSGDGGIEHTINDAGTPTLGSFGISTVTSYP